MSYRHQPPAYLRYWKAQLQPLGRPAFWGAAVLLSLMLWFVREYWNRPELLRAIGINQVADTDTPTVEPTLSSEDDELAATLADIDNSAVLLAELEALSAISVPPQQTNKARKSKTKNSEGLFTQVIQQTKANSQATSPLLTPNVQPQQSSKARNPFVTSTNDLFNIPPVPGTGLLTNPNSVNQRSLSSSTLNQTNSVLGLGSFNSPYTNPAELPVSPLQEALNRLNAAKSNTGNSKAQLPANILPSNISYGNRGVLEQRNSGTQEIKARGGIPLSATGNQALPTPSYPGQITYPGVTTPGLTGNRNFSTTPTTAPYPGQINYPGVNLPRTRNDRTFPTTPTVPTVPLNSNTYSSPFRQATGVPTAAPLTPVAPQGTSKLGQFSTQSTSQNQFFNQPQLKSKLEPSQLRRPKIIISNP
ncbi:MULTISPECIES: hypothetical protein [Moorena]|nr:MULTISPECIES: hypothetical protein [Moorena]NEQ14948.1 hypothetical protein [Moorena sp. SIO3E2]NEP31840.1 hypothetical protein [Moorena sp. SIO3B2]NEP70132.1 hypothetical protein [Moorena sp. SIO3A5]NEQ06308.1 hypothetical protein [Moorena sp. SIO4E2]NER90637.1 hypothetical protein [Moorena sp. SIO3A2]